MSSITLKNVSLSYPTYAVKSRSIKSVALDALVGGRLKKEKKSVYVDAINNMSLSLKDGDRLGIIGHNGAGKSTLLKMLAGVYIPQSGTVDVQGDVSALLDVNLGMQPDLSGYDNIKLRAKLMNYPADRYAELVADIEEFTEMGDYLQFPVKTYSSGMLLRLSFGLSTAIAPDILLIDEVIGAGDNHFIEKAKARLAQFIHQSKILVLSSHSMDIVKEFCTRVIWMSKGQVVFFGETDECIDRYTNNRSTA